MPPDPDGLPIPHAVALGALHGVAELVPISSSAHVSLVPLLLDWPAARLSPDVRKAFAVALHTGTLPPMLWLVPRPGALFALITTAPAAVLGLLFEHPIEERLDGPRPLAAGLLAGSALLLLADARGPRTRRAEDAGVGDAVLLGLAQALALAPGTSRLGLTVAAARALGFEREAAYALGRSAGLPVVAGATALKTWRLSRDGLAPALRAPFAAGALAAAVAVTAARPLLRVTSAAPFAAERALLAGATLAFARRRRGR